MQILHEQKLAKICIELDDGKQGLQVSSRQYNFIAGGKPDSVVLQSYVLAECVYRSLLIIHLITAEQIVARNRAEKEERQD